jgi:ABC-type sugar transport system substrate-binding protein
MRTPFQLLSVAASIGMLFAYSETCLAQANKGTVVFIPKSTSATFYLFLVKGAKDRAKELGYTIDFK